MIGLPEKVCCLCGDPATLAGLFADYAGRSRFVCGRHAALPIRERNRLLLTGGNAP